MAAVPGSGLQGRARDVQAELQDLPVSGYSPALSAGDFRFVPGQTGEARKDGEGPLDPEVRHPRALWRQWPIKLETEFIIKRKLTPCLEGAGASLDSVVKAQVYLSDREDVPGFNEVWLSHFKSPPATTIIATANPGFAINDLRIEINTISLATKGKTKREVIRGPGAAGVRRLGVGDQGGDLLFLSGLMAVEDGRLIDEARVDMRQPFYGIPVKAELRSIIRQAEAICRSAGTSLRNAVRIQQFHTDLADLRGRDRGVGRGDGSRAAAAVGDRGALAADPRRARAGRSVGLRAPTRLEKLQIRELNVRERVRSGTE